MNAFVVVKLSVVGAALWYGINHLLNKIECHKRSIAIKQFKSSLVPPSSPVSSIPHPTRVSENHPNFNSLPECIQRYLRYSKVIGTVIPRSIHTKQIGEIRLNPSGEWKHIQCEQWSSGNPSIPSFVWLADMPMFHLNLSASEHINLFHIQVQDSYSRNKGGGSRISMMKSLIPLASARTCMEMEESALQRYLAELIFIPSALLHPSIVWKSIDDSCAEAQLTSARQELSVSLRFHFDPQTAQITKITGDRYYAIDNGERYEKNAWIVKLTDYKLFHIQVDHDGDGDRNDSDYHHSADNAGGEYHDYTLMLPELATITWMINSEDGKGKIPFEAIRMRFLEYHASV